VEEDAALDMMWGMPGMMLFGAAFWLAILVAVGLGIWWLATRARRRVATARSMSAERS
jgi:uncharacterized membrane protein